MTKVLVTVDTELSAGLQGKGMSCPENANSSIWGKCASGAYGIGWQMDQLEARGLKGVYFIDPLPALVHGSEFLAETVQSVISRGHEVQLHIHTEWLEWVPFSPVGGGLGRDIGNFGLEEQTILLGLAADLLENAGAPRPIAFRAGNYGANDDSLQALANLGLGWDSSFNAPYLGNACHISLPPTQVHGIRHKGLIELPVAGLCDTPHSIRPAQVCALSASEMQAALHHAAANRHPAFVIVTHSFEMLSRDRQRPNRTVMQRFEAMCDTIARHPQLESAGFLDLDANDILTPDLSATRLAPDRWRRLKRIGEQAWANWAYERQLKPA